MRWAAGVAHPLQLPPLMLKETVQSAVACFPAARSSGRWRIDGVGGGKKERQAQNGDREGGGSGRGRPAAGSRWSVGCCVGPQWCGVHSRILARRIASTLWTNWHLDLVTAPIAARVRLDVGACAPFHAARAHPHKCVSTLRIKPTYI